MVKIIGRETEIAALKQYMQSKEPEFIAVYGRRRVGKTFLINETFKDNFAFSITATTDKDRAAQLRNFNAAIINYGGTPASPAKTWPEAFEQLQELIEGFRGKGKKVIFFDELPWFDTRKSGFLSAFGHFWNVWGSRRSDILLIVCGSATSWMVGRLLYNRGSLHNRVTGRIRLAPFTLKETEAYLRYRGIYWERADIAQIYMAFGGIPFYLRMLDPKLSAAQNIDKLCFGKDAQMREEFDILYASLFSEPQKYLKILEVLASNKNGLTREDIISKTGMSSGGAISETLEELRQCGFIEQYNDYSGKRGRYIYQIIDFFTIFYFKNMKNNRQRTGGYWVKSVGSGTWNNWVGQTFEKLCITHLDNIKDALSIGGIIATPYAWKSVRANPTAQIDLLIDRADNAINICECKFTQEPFAIDKSYSANLRNKIAAFREEGRKRKTLFLTMITTYGVKQNTYSGMVQSEVVLDDLF